MRDTATLTLLCYGDSNTHGTLPLPDLQTKARMAREDRWVTHLAHALPDWEVIAEGLPGRTVLHDDPIEGAHRNGLTLLSAILESHAPIDLVLVMLGTNDLKPRFGMQAAEIAQSLERMTRAILSSGCGPGGGAPQVLLVAPPPIAETGCLAGMFAGGATKSRALAPALAQVATRLGVGFVDAAPLVQVSAVDGIHYEVAAMPALAKGLVAAVQSAMPQNSTD